jgi:broad specificity phosphatase PhoE
MLIYYINIMVRVKIIRHSERLDYANPLSWIFYFGSYWYDSPLTYRGHEMAAEKGAKMVSDDYHPKYIYTSPYTRTISTATEIKSSFPSTEIIIEPLLAEYQPTWQHRIALYPSGIPTTFDGKETGFVYPEVEYAKFEERVQFIIRKLIEKHDDDIMIITHGEFLKSYINHLQLSFPELMLDSGTTPYLTTLTFDYDKDASAIIPKSIIID